MSDMSIWLINRTLSCAIISGQSEPGSDGNEGVLSIPQISSTTETSLYIYMIWFCLVYGISTLVGYLISKTLYTYILDIYDSVWLGFMVYQPL